MAVCMTVCLRVAWSCFLLCPLFGLCLCVVPFVAIVVRCINCFFLPHSHHLLPLHPSPPLRAPSFLPSSRRSPFPSTPALITLSSSSSLFFSPLLKWFPSLPPSLSLSHLGPSSMHSLRSLSPHPVYTCTCLTVSSWMRSSLVVIIIVVW